MTRVIAVAAVVIGAGALASGQQPAPAGAGAGAAPMIVVAGQGTAGFADGRGAEARFNKPIRLAPLGADAIAVSDIYNHAIRAVVLNN
jgi:hypothetical protein